MKERPLLFKGEMVRAILAGTKTQTRRPVKADARTAVIDAGGYYWPFKSDGRASHAVDCPYGVPGDRLWIKETWKPLGVCYPEWVSVQYAADEVMLDRPYVQVNFARKGWRTCMFMPRPFSRIDLDVTGVRLERLQDISEADAAAEGVLYASGDFEDNRAAYAALWDSINGKGAWALNPWVWVVDFKRSAA